MFMAFTMIVAVSWRKADIFAKCLEVESVTLNNKQRTKKEDPEREALKFLKFAKGQVLITFIERGKRRMMTSSISEMLTLTYLSLK